MVKPILFNTDMVRAILDGRKTQTRRIMKPQPILENRLWKFGDAGWSDNIKGFHPVPCHSLFNREPYQPGDILYVRETWHIYQKRVGEGDNCRIEERYGYKASIANSEDADTPWRPSIHMPKEAARIWLRVTDVRLERLQEITEDGVKEEGCIDTRAFIHSYDNEYDPIDTAREDFMEIWDSTIKKSDLDRYGWEANPWVWVITFERTEKPR